MRDNRVVANDWDHMVDVARNIDQIQNQNMVD
jgi:hypothetical protein